MHAYLLIGERGLGKKIKEIVGETSQSVNFDLQKIDDVRDLRSLTKYYGSEKRFYIFKDFQNASIEAMNALLKLLEEPGENINFILCVTTERNILETITSRCEVIKLRYKKNDSSLKKARDFFNMKTSLKLELLHKISKREDASKFFSDLIEEGHTILTTNYNKYPNLASLIDTAISTKNDIEKNANVAIAITKFSLNLVYISKKNYN